MSFIPIIATSITTGSDLDGGAAATTASITLPAYQLCLLGVVGRRSDSTAPGAPTLSGTGTWVQIATVEYDTTSTSRRSLTLFRHLSVTAATGTVTITYGANETEIRWLVDKLYVVNTSGTSGATAIVQSNTNSSLSANSLTVTLANVFSSSYNGTYGLFASSGSDGKTAGTGFTAVSQTGGNADAVSVFSEFKDTGDTTVDYSQTNTHEIGGIAIEVRSFFPVQKYIDAGGIL